MGNVVANFETTYVLIIMRYDNIISLEEKRRAGAVPPCRNVLIIMVKKFYEGE